MRQLSIKAYDIKDLVSEGRLASDFDKYFDSSPKIGEKDKLGFVNFGGTNIPGFSITEWENIFYEDVKVSGYSAEPHLALHFMLKGSNAYEIKNTDSIIAKQDTNNLWSLNGDYFGNEIFKKNEYCLSIGIYIHNDFLEELTNRYPDLLGEVYRRCMNGETFFHHPQYQNTTLEMKQIVSQIRNAKLMGNSSEIYTEAKILELLALQLQGNTFCRIANCYTYCKNISDVEKIREAKKILIADLNQPISIRQLSRQVGMNENKLKYGFKEIYNTTIFGYLFDYKMDLANKLLLDTNMNILEIAHNCGYEYASHFTTAFKRKYGVTPKEFRNRS
ncbi:MAG: AraC family transcriptional regulator [Ignavibacteria bacterium]|jgi:AraC-like DNA-binding protein